MHNCRKCSHFERHGEGFASESQVGESRQGSQCACIVTSVIKWCNASRPTLRSETKESSIQHSLRTTTALLYCFPSTSPLLYSSLFRHGPGSTRLFACSYVDLAILVLALSLSATHYPAHTEYSECSIHSSHSLCISHTYLTQPCPNLSHCFLLDVLRLSRPCSQPWRTSPILQNY